LVVVHGQFEKSSNAFYSKNLRANNITTTDYRYHQCEMVERDRQSMAEDRNKTENERCELHEYKK
jgi:hypothetical protein